MAKVFIEGAGHVVGCHDPSPTQVGVRQLGPGTYIADDSTVADLHT